MELVKRWFLENRRVFPWREGGDAYSVLVSEVMLQQTRAGVVISYFERWMKRFPNVEALSLATEGEVVKLWEGLGYYSRARNLLQFAKRVVFEYHGEIPDRLEELLKFKGIGDYTAGAILSFGFHKKAVALDGNVTRVMARWFAFEKQNKKELQQKIFEILPDQESYIVMEGLIELGATVCLKRPRCNLCPLQNSCLAHQRGLTGVLPLLRARKPITELFRFVGCIAYQDEYLLKQGETGKLMAGLFEFPYIECEKDPIPSIHQKELEQLFKLPLTLITPFQREKHHFTRYKANLYPFHFITLQKKEIAGYVWVHKNLLETIPFSAGHKKIYKSAISMMR